MKLGELATQIGARVLTPPRRRAGVEVTRVYAGDIISDLLREASETTLLVTHLASPQLLRVAELMDLAGICFVQGREPTPEIVAAAAERGIVLMVSPLDLFETCGALHACTHPAGPAEP